MRKHTRALLCPLHGCHPSYTHEIYNQHCCIHTFFCRKCREARTELNKPLAKTLSSFGYGFSAQGSAGAALRNWNGAIERLKRTCLKNAIAGKGVSDELFARSNDDKAVRCFDVRYAKFLPTESGIRYRMDIEESFCQVVAESVLSCENEIKKVDPDAVILAIDEDEDYEPED